MNSYGTRRPRTVQRASDALEVVLATSKVRRSRNPVLYQHTNSHACAWTVRAVSTAQTPSGSEAAESATGKMRVYCETKPDVASTDGVAGCGGERLLA